MAENSAIEWTDHTFNPWIGCTKVSPGCDHCYAERDMASRLKVVQWGPHGARVRTKPANWAKPQAWNRRHDEFFAQHGRRQRVFCASLADVFDNAVDPAWRADLFALIHATPNLDWLLLTKRIGNVAGMLRDTRHGADEDLSLLDMMPLPNVWIGASVVNQEEAERDIPKLLAVPARVRFLSMEPLLGPVDFYEVSNAWFQRGYTPWNNAPILDGIHWVIVGGESGPAARPMHPDWARSLRDQCAAAGVPFLFKQWGEWRPVIPGEGAIGAQLKWQDGGVSIRVGKKAAGRQLDGAQHDGYPSAISGTF